MSQVQSAGPRHERAVGSFGHRLATPQPTSDCAGGAVARAFLSAWMNRARRRNRADEIKRRLWRSGRRQRPGSKEQELKTQSPDSRGDSGFSGPAHTKKKRPQLLSLPGGCWHHHATLLGDLLRLLLHLHQILRQLLRPGTREYCILNIDAPIPLRKQTKRLRLCSRDSA